MHTRPSKTVGLAKRLGPGCPVIVALAGFQRQTCVRFGALTGVMAVAAAFVDWYAGQLMPAVALPTVPVPVLAAAATPAGTVSPRTTATTMMARCENPIMFPSRLL